LAKAQTPEVLRVCTVKCLDGLSKLSRQKAIEDFKVQD
jgi:hypothetical protein